MPTYAVKHIVDEHGPLSASMMEVRKTPYSYTSKEPEASDAATGQDIYVIEVRTEGKARRYSLGYRYRATEKFSRPGALWKDEFRFKNSATPGNPPVGVYFDPFLELTDQMIVSWLASKQPGMAEIPADVLEALAKAERDAATTVKHFK